MIFLILILAVFFAVNMGGSSFAVSFAASYGGRMLARWKAALLFTLFVILGSVLFGDRVSVTLGKGIMPEELMSAKAVLIIFLASGLSMFSSNLMKIPQSTSLVTVAAIAGVGAYYQKVNLSTIFCLIPFWILLPLVSYFLTYWITGRLYPPRRTNFWIYEHFINHQNKLKVFVVASNCYNALAVGTNNVANVAGPFLGLSPWPLFSLLFLFALVYGAGGFAFTGPLKTAGENIVPLGLMTASIISMVSGSLIIFASLLGVPQSVAMIQMAAIFAIAALKHGTDLTWSDPLTRKTFFTWAINPVITFFVTLGLSWIIL